ncbi:MAG: transporter ATP-binding protein [Myxococcales bacterium]|nr:transporter ATP-binding protein [Myxococcales bacterium]
MSGETERAEGAKEGKEAAVDRKSDQYQIRIRGLTKSFGDHKVLRGVDLDVERGKIHIIIGGSGQGKSVLMKHLMGLLKPDAGHIWVDGEDVVPLDDVELNRVRRKFGMLFQYAALFDSLTVEQNVAFPLIEHTKKSKSEIHEMVTKRLNSLGLRNIEKKFPAELSGGMRKRVGLARALVLEPQILLYDEPTTGLDPVATKNVDDMIRDISKETGVTSVVISHDMASTFRIAHRISMLYEGKIAVTGSPEEIKRSNLPFVREFVEMSGTVQFEGNDKCADDDEDTQTRPGDR